MLREDLPKRCIARRALRHALRQLRDGCVRGILDGADTELHAEVNEQLVAAGGHAFHEGFYGIGRGHLIRPDLGPQRDEHLKSLVHAERAILDGGWGLLARGVHGVFPVCALNWLPRLRLICLCFDGVRRILRC